MDLEKFLELAESHRKIRKAHVGEKTLAEVYAEHAHRTSSLKFSVLSGRAHVCVDGFASALNSY